MAKKQTFTLHWAFQVKSPCLDCQRRHINCHGDCSDYLEYRNDLVECKKSYAKFKTEKRLAVPHAWEEKAKKKTRNYRVKAI